LDLPLFVGLRRDTADIALEQVKGMERLIRNHPSNIVISYINEPIFEFYDGRVGMMPRNELVPTFRIFDDAVWTLNPDQVIKWVDGDYANISAKYSDHHCYSLWYKGHGLGFRQQYFGAWMATPPGWMYGCGEFGSEGLDSPELMKKYYPKEWIEEKPDGSWSPYQVPRAQSGKMGLFDSKGQLLADTTQILDLFPSADKPSDSTVGGPPDAGGQPQRLIEDDYNTRAPYQP